MAKTVLDVVTFVWKHPANKGRRISQLGRAMKFQLVARMLRRKKLTPIGYRSMLWAELHCTAATRVLYSGWPDMGEMKFWANFLTPGDLFVDVGANVGPYTIIAAEAGARVIAVEPDEGAAERLKGNLQVNGYKGEVLLVALADQVGTRGFTYGLGAGNHLSPMAERCVQVETLDRVLGGGTARGVKIDVEGAERLVLEGARTTLSKQRVEVWQVEWNRCSKALLNEERGRVAEMLVSAGYVLARADYNGELVPTWDLESECEMFAALPSVLSKT